LKRIKRKGAKEDNFLAAVLERDIADKEGVIAGIQSVISRGTKMLELLGEYKYQVDLSTL